MIIPHEKLSPEALQGLIEQFVSRDGIDSGHVKTTLAEKVAIVKSNLKSGRSFIVFDSDSQTWNILSKDEIPFNILK
jgi:uncharacterized protein YheU (UPF0270 family)